MVIHLSHRGSSAIKTHEGFKVSWVEQETMFQLVDTFCGEEVHEWECLHIDIVKLMPQLFDSGQLCQECLYSSEAGLELLADL